MSDLRQALLDAADNVVNQCMAIVPSAPLIRLEGLANAVSGDLGEDDVGDPILDLMGTIDDLGWRFWPSSEYGSTTAAIDPEAVCELGAALAKYRSEIEAK